MEAVAFPRTHRHPVIRRDHAALRPQAPCLHHRTGSISAIHPYAMTLRKHPLHPDLGEISYL
jgi:hypothetical protein